MIDQAWAPSRQTLHNLDLGRVAALAVTLLLHVLLVAALLQGLPRQVDVVHEDTVISLTFIDRSRPKANPSKPRLMSPPSHSATVSKTASTALAAPEIDVSTPAPPQSSSGRSASTLDLSIKEPDSTFSPPDPLKRPGKRWEASVPRMQLRMVDSSFAGRLQAMQKRRICGELRAALVGSSASTAAILASMADFGCKI
ncbi:MAG: hypothetical protein LH470_05565 [Lysobacter sp.]|nr:hypothetical protein [Lysobacter sp.]